MAEKKEKVAEEKVEAAEEKKKEDKKKKETKKEEAAAEPKAKASSKEAKGTVVADVIEAVKGMTVLELSELVKELEETFGVSAAAPVAVAAAGGAAAGGAAPAEEEKDSFDVILSSVGDKKIQVIKVVRSLTGLGLKEAKAVVDEAPKPVKEKVAKEEAEKMKKELEDAGATVELK